MAFHSSSITTLDRVRSSQMRVIWQRPIGFRWGAPISRTLQPLPCFCWLLNRRISNPCCRAAMGQTRANQGDAGAENPVVTRVLALSSLAPNRAPITKRPKAVPGISRWSQADANP